MSRQILWQLLPQLQQHTLSRTVFCNFLSLSKQPLIIRNRGDVESGQLCHRSKMSPLKSLPFNTGWFYFRLGVDHSFRAQQEIRSSEEMVTCLSH